MRCKLKLFFSLVGICCSLLIGQAYAGFSLGSTRVVVLSQDTQVLKVTNHGDIAFAMQAWAETPAGGNPGHALVVSPSFAKLAGDSNLDLKVMSLAKSTDTEQLYYLNVQEIPPKAKKDHNGVSGNKIAFAVRTKIKVFVRTEALQEQRRNAEKAVSVSLSENGKQLHINNPTPFYFTMDTALLEGEPLSISKDGLIAPKAKQTVALDRADLLGKEVEISFIDDYGAKRQYSYAIQ